MELYQLRSFAAVADAGHLTRAAERLHLSQPALSAHIRALEDELGVRVFERTASGMVLTRAGQELLQRARSVIAAAEQMRRAALAMNGALSGHLRIGSVSDPEFIRLGDFLGRAVDRYPLLELEVHHEMSGAALEKVRDATLDASFYFGDAPGREVAALALTEVVYRVAGPVAWKPRIERADWDAIAALPWIVTPPISTHHRLVHALFGERGVEPSKVVEADNESVISNLIESGVGLSLLREDLARAKQAAGEVCVWPPARLSTTLWFIWLAERQGDPPIAALRELLEQTWHAAPEQAARTHEPAQI
jgi:DNA-binding transcriptional LysR family regulator